MMITIRRFYLAFLLSGVALGKTWPGKITPLPAIGKFSRSNESSFSYLTTNYKILSFKNHDVALITDFIKCAESVPLALKAIPLPLYDPPKESKGIIQIVETVEHYRKAGGAKNTAGFYDGRQEKVIIQWAHFKNNTDHLQGPAFDLVIHELTHLAMHGFIWKTEPWFIEGVAEYLAAAHTGKGNFDFTKIDSAIRARVRNHSKPGLLEIPVLKVETLLKLSSKDWLKRTATLPPWQTLDAYKTSLLLVHYAFHGGSDRRKQSWSYLNDLKKISKRGTPRPLLFPIEEAPKIEQAIQRYWKQRGLRLKFSEH